MLSLIWKRSDDDYGHFAPVGEGMAVMGRGVGAPAVGWREDLCKGTRTCRLLVTNMAINDDKCLVRDGVYVQELQPGAFAVGQKWAYISFLQTYSAIPTC